MGAKGKSESGRSLMPNLGETSRWAPLRKGVDYRLMPVLIGILVSPSLALAQVTIDDFATPQDLQFLTCTGDLATSVSNFASAGLGGERDITLTLEVCGSMGLRALTQVTGGEFSWSNDNGVASTAVIQWDGIDGSSTLDPTGLGGVDLTTVGQDTFRLRVDEDDLSVDVTIDVYTDGSNASRCTVTLPGAITMSTDFGFNFPGNMTDDCTFSTLLGSGATFTNVGAIEMTVGGAAFPATDLELDFLETDDSPVPVELMSFDVD